MIRVYNKDLNLIAILQNAFNVGYDKKINSLWLANFSLPGNDPKAIYCQPFNYVEIFDGDERVDLFRIMPGTYEKQNGSMQHDFSCEHVLSTLFDDVLFQYHQLTNQSPSNVISYILSKQTVQRWQLGTVDFTALYSYKWENENLASAIASVTKPYTEEFLWTWDTTVYPWRLNLVRPSTQISAYIRYRKNLKGITKQVDPSNIVTRYYPLGYGEGDNQLTIKSVNGGVPYITADTAATYGIISDFFIDKTEENPAMLKAKAEKALNSAKVPKIIYTVDAADIHQITKEPIDRFVEGALVQVYDDESGIEFAARIIGVAKPDLTGDPGNIKLEIANVDTKKLSYEVFEIKNRQRISDVYAQGATNIDSNDYQDNCDATHPAVIEFYIPEDCVRVNECWLSYKCEKFRAYEKGATAKDLGTVSISQNTSGQSSINTTEIGAHQHTYGEIDTTEADGSTGLHKHAILRDNTWSGGNHSHGMEHTHPIDHSHVIGEHNHEIEYGIFEEETLPTSLNIKVDGSIIEITDLNANKIDIIPYLSTDAEGKIRRGVFHTIEITPNNLARITASVVKKIFIQSRGTYSV